MQNCCEEQGLVDRMKPAGLFVSVMSKILAMLSVAGHLRVHCWSRFVCHS